MVSVARQAINNTKKWTLRVVDVPGPMYIVLTRESKMKIQLNVIQLYVCLLLLLVLSLLFLKLYILYFQ